DLRNIRLTFLLTIQGTSSEISSSFSQRKDKISLAHVLVRSNLFFLFFQFVCQTGNLPLHTTKKHTDAAQKGMGNTAYMALEFLFLFFPFIFLLLSLPFISQSIPST